jgi:S-formylglutathione hydrolase FrmB
MSESLMRTVNVNVILPVDKLLFPGMKPKTGKYKTLYLMHGVLGSQFDWISGSRVQRWAEEKDLAVVMPAGENMFYVDQPKGNNYYGEFIGRELPELMEKIFPLSDKREDRYIAGLSMGGYGAIRNGLKYADNFSRIGGFSSAFFIKDVDKRTNENIMIFFESRDYAEACFGDLKKVAGSDLDPMYLVSEMKRKKIPSPELYMSCGTRDSLYPANCEYRDLFKAEGLEVTWNEAPFDHEWDFWDQELQRFIAWLPLDEASKGMNSGNVGI